MPDGTFVVIEADGKALRVIPASSVVDGYRESWGETRVWTEYWPYSRPIREGEHLFAGYVRNEGGHAIPVVPEPSRICLVLLGLAFAGLRRRRSV